ncbi:SHOCT domain-containing protein [Streptomyces sp. NPDC007084]|uniref:SHOCT domain-containing protein n=1 Tax=Streptomyces sp. NPDC007084 TaxID=3154313 RepID=UPI003453C87E
MSYDDRSSTMNGSALVLAADYPLLNVFWTTMWFFLWILWFMLLFRVVADIFRDDDLHGWGKAGWCVFVVVLPFLGVFVYLIARGRGMGEREARRVRQSQEEVKSYIRETAGSTGRADELAKLAELRSNGHLTSEEFEQAKAKVLAA